MKKFFCKLKNHIERHGNYYGFTCSFFVFSMIIIGNFIDVLPDWFMPCWFTVYYHGCSFADELDRLSILIKEKAV